MREVQAIIDENAKLEFECLWREHARTGRLVCAVMLETVAMTWMAVAGIPRCTLTDTLSQKITDLSARIEDNETLWANDALRNGVLRSALPKVCGVATLAAVLCSSCCVSSARRSACRRCVVDLRLWLPAFR